MNVDQNEVKKIISQLNLIIEEVDNIKKNLNRLCNIDDNLKDPNMEEITNLIYSVIYCTLERAYCADPSYDRIDPLIAELDHHFHMSQCKLRVKLKDNLKQKEQLSHINQSLSNIYHQAVDKYKYNYGDYEEPALKIPYIPSDCPWELTELLDKNINALIESLPNHY